MKYIFDFDDVLFKNTEMLKPRMFSLIAKAVGNSPEEIKALYQGERKEFSLVNFIKKVLSQNGQEAPGAEVDSLFKEIMSESHNFLDLEMIEEIKKIPKEDLYIVTNGESNFNWSKLTYSGILEYFLTDHIEVVPGPKIDAIHKICDANPNEEIIFIDDRDYFIEGLDRPNIKPLLYLPETKATVLKKLKEVSRNPAREEVRMK